DIFLTFASGNQTLPLTRKSGTCQVTPRASLLRFDPRRREHMTTREFLTNAAMLSSIMAVAALIEAAVPMFAPGSRTPGRRLANLGLTAVVFLLNWLLSSTAAILAIAVSLQPPNLARNIVVPTPL